MLRPPMISASTPATCSGLRAGIETWWIIVSSCRASGGDQHRDAAARRQRGPGRLVGRPALRRAAGRRDRGAVVGCDRGGDIEGDDAWRLVPIGPPGKLLGEALLLVAALCLTGVRGEAFGRLLVPGDAVGRGPGITRLLGNLRPAIRAVGDNRARAGQRADVAELQRAVVVRYAGELAVELGGVGKPLLSGLWIEDVKADRVVGAVGIGEKDRTVGIPDEIDCEIGDRQLALARQRRLLARRRLRPVGDRDKRDFPIADLLLVPFLDHDPGEIAAADFLVRNRLGLRRAEPDVLDREGLVEGWVGG